MTITAEGLRVDQEYEDREPAPIAAPSFVIDEDATEAERQQLLDIQVGLQHNPAEQLASLAAFARSGAGTTTAPWEGLTSRRGIGSLYAFDEITEAVIRHDPEYARLRQDRKNPDAGRLLRVRRLAIFLERTVTAQAIGKTIVTQRQTEL